MPGHELGYSMGLVTASGILSIVGAFLASRLLAREPVPARFWSAIIRAIPGGLLMAATSWLLFTLALKLHFPRLGPDLPVPTMLRAWAIVAAGAIAAQTIARRPHRTVRNVALAGSVMASSVSCMVFASMGDLAAPSALAYDLSDVIEIMVASSAIWAAGLWLLKPSGGRRLLSVSLMAASLLLLTDASLSCILPFSGWNAVTATPEAIAFQPVTVVFLSELGMTLMLGIAGAGVDRQVAALAMRENSRLRQLGESTFEALLIHGSGIILDANSSFCELVGRPLASLKGLPIETFLPEGDRTSAISPITGRPEAFEAQIAGANGKTMPVEVLSRDVQFAGGAARVTALRDIRERRAAEARIRFMAQHDTLTGLANRSRFQDVIGYQLAKLRRDGIPLAVMCIDLDRFKHVNDTLGHAAGDLLLRQVAERLLRTVRETDTVARIGGDEFVLLQTAVVEPGLSAKLAARIIESLSEPFDLNGHQVTIGASVGIALAPRDSAQADVLVQNADVALYRAKTSARGTYCFFRAGMDTLLRERRELEQDIIRATASGGFDLAFQPQFNGASPGELTGFEALLRWHHPRLGIIPPGQIIPLAEETGLIVPLGAWVLEAACREAAGWPSRHRVAVNVSPRQLIEGDFPSLVRTVLHRSGLAPDRLEIEVTETLLIQHGEAALGLLQQLKQLGVRLALDDFGAGYSSLGFLQRFRFDNVKIDQSFVRSVTSSEDARAIIAAILAMGHQLRLEVTAEGVETAEQLAFLRTRPFDRMQGFLLAHPLPRDAVRDYIIGTQTKTLAAPLLTVA